MRREVAAPPLGPVSPVPPPVRGGPLLPSAVGAAGGAALAAGAFLPWITFFAGLQGYAGVSGVYGRVLLAAGLAGTGLSLAYLRGGTAPLRAAMGVVGATAAAFSVWLLIGLSQLEASLRASPMLVARPGPGLYVCLAGAVALTAASLLPGRRSRTGR